ncbi:MAG TPA: hypothetical protein VL463_13800, partial [Kofleriaceae bacterium]|nr:hypothetical protein [Kofleriaceae bacterium]
MRSSFAVVVALAACSSPPPKAPAPPPDAAAPVHPERSPEGAESKEADPPAPTFRLGDALKPTHVRARLRIDPDQPGFAGEVW